MAICLFQDTDVVLIQKFEEQADIVHAWPGWLLAALDAITSGMRITG
jgi:hypothetical protein